MGRMSFEELDRLLEEEGASSGVVPTHRDMVVVVDDDEAARKALTILLRSRYTVVTCASGAEGVVAVSEDTCAVVLDIKMSDHDGFWTCDQIRKRFPDVPVILFSAYQDVKSPYEIINQHRPFGYFMKGGDPDLLLKCVERAVRLHRMAINNRRIVETLRRSRREGPPR